MKAEQVLEEIVYSLETMIKTRRRLNERHGDVSYERRTDIVQTCLDLVESKIQNLNP